eukprot:gene4293-5014_t
MLDEEELDISIELNPKTNQHEMKQVKSTLSFDQGFFHAIRAIELLAETNPSRAIILGIAGPVGAGKTTLAQKISALVNAIVIDLQDFVKLDMVKDNNYDDPVLIDYDLVVDTLNKLKQGHTVEVPKIIKQKDPTLPKTVEMNRISLSSSKVLILEGSYALSAKIRPMLDVSIAITGGVHLDLIKRIMRDIVSAKSSTKDVLLQITNVVFPMFKAFVEPDLDQAKIKIHSSYNPMSQVVEPTYVCKAKYESHKEHFDQFLSSLNVSPVKKIFSDMYLYPPKYGTDGLSQADKTNWIRIRRTDKGQFNIYFYREVMDATINTRPSLNFEISVKTIGGLLSLGYQIGAILNRTIEVWYEKSGIIITKEYIKELEKYFIQIKGQNRREVIGFADKLKMTNIHTVIRNERYVYLLGGWDSPTSVERLDLHTMEFITCASMLTGRINLGALLIIGEDPAFLAVGGHTPSGESLASIEIYDPLFDTRFQDEYIALSTRRHSQHVAYFAPGDHCTDTNIRKHQQQYIKSLSNEPTFAHTISSLTFQSSFIYPPTGVLVLYNATNIHTKLKLNSTLRISLKDVKQMTVNHSSIFKQQLDILSSVKSPSITIHSRLVHKLLWGKDLLSVAKFNFGVKSLAFDSLKWGTSSKFTIYMVHVGSIAVVEVIQDLAKGDIIQ